MDKKLQIVVDDGYKKVPIVNTNGEEIGVLYFNPSDVGIIERYNKIADKFDSITEPMARKAPEGLSEAEKMQFDIDCSKEASERLYEACNELFGGDFASAFFGRTNPWSPNGGKFYCEEALEKVGAFFASYFEKEVKAIESRAQKYLNRAQRRKK